jgi:hypothetical protein
MNNFSFKRVMTTVKNNFRINKSIPLLIFIVIAILMFLSTTLPVSSAEDSYLPAAVNYERYSWYLESIRECWETIVGIMGIQAVCGVIAAIGTALLCSITLTAYSRDKKGSDFWNSQPVTRREHLTANLISSFLYFFVSIVPTWYLSLGLAHIFTSVPPMTLGEIFAAQTPPLLFLLLFYMAVVSVGFLSATVAGSVMSVLVFFATFLGYPALMTVFAGYVSDSVFNTPLQEILEHNYTLFAYSSPVLRYFFGVNGTYALGVKDYILYALFTVAIIALLFVIVNKRRNENAQNAVVFPILRYPLQYLWTFFFTLFASWFLYMIIWSPVWFVVGAVIGLLLSFIILNMIFERSFTGFFKKPKHLIICSVSFIIFTLIFVADVFGIYKEPTPDFDDIIKVSVYYNAKEEEENAEYTWIDIYSTDEKPVETDLDREMIERLWIYLEKKRGSTDNSYYTGESDVWYSVNLVFYCKNDPSSWSVHSGFYNADSEFHEIINYLASRFETYSDTPEETVTSFPKVSDITINDDTNSVGIIGGADGPTAVIIS